MAIAVVSRRDITRWDAQTSLEHLWGGHKDGFVATCVLEIAYEENCNPDEPDARWKLQDY